MSQSSRTGWIRLPAFSLLVVAVTLGAAGTLQAQEPHVVFVTSVGGTGNLGSWPEAETDTSGLEAADSICRNLASAALLANPNDFVAWLSDSDDDAYCRVHGLTGKKATNCGQGTLPVAAGPWVRTDGHPFTPGIDSLLSPTFEIYVPAAYDENGQPVSDQIFTGTSSTGVGAAELCTDGGTLVDWASGIGSGRVGSTYETDASWTDAFIGGCYSSHRLLCIEKGQGGPLPSFAQIGKLAFVTSAYGPGNLGAWPQADPGTSGIAAGDSICRTLATTAGLPVPSSFRAWLSDSGIDAKDRFVNPGPWVRVDGVFFVSSPGDLTTYPHFTSLNVTETGSYLSNKRAWTGTSSSGSVDPDTCSQWIDGTPGSQGRVGFCATISSGWTANTSSVCEWVYHLYCLAVVDGIFEDGFETGDTSAW